MNQEVFDRKYKALNPKQKEAVDTVYGPVMVIAGPGTGKTTVLTLRIANILRQTDAKPEEILAITFTDSGVKAMREKLREIIGDASFRVHIYTFHAFANYMRALYPENFKHIGDRIPANDLDAIEVIEEIFEEVSFQELRVSTFGTTVKGIKTRISELKREYIDPAKLLSLVLAEEASFQEEIEGVEKKTKTYENEIERKQKYFTRMKEFVSLFELYEKKLKERGIYDFDDTIIGLIYALKENPLMQTEMRESFQFILADEHQDANGAQNEILKFFSDPTAIDPPNLFVVGDDKQSIFRFQGASLENFYSFKELFPDALKIDLEENYRSHKTILDASHSLIVSDGMHHTKLSARASFEEKPIEINEYTDEEQELQAVAYKVKECLERAQDETVAVLARNNDTLSRLAMFLKALNVPYSLKGEKSLFESLEYQKIVTLLKAVVSPWQKGDLVKTLFFGFFEMSIRDIFFLQDLAKEERRTFGDVFLSKKTDYPLEDKESFVKTKEVVLELVEQALRLPLLAFLKLLREKIILSDKTELYEILKLVFTEAEKLTLKKRNAMLADLVAHLDLIQKHNITPLSHLVELDSNVTLCSIHKSKGLEFDTVFVLGVTDKAFEKDRKRSDSLQVPGLGTQKELAEERRLLYVAITRAKQHVVLSYALLGRKDDALAPSVLLDELDSSLVKRTQCPNTVVAIDLLQVTDDFSSDIKASLRERFLKRGFSVSALNNYLECPYRYLFRNLLLIPDVLEFSALLGTSCHEVLRRLHLKAKRGETLSGEALTQIIKEEVSRQPFSQIDLPLALTKVTENIEAYTKTFDGFGDTQVFVEESFNFPLNVATDNDSFEILINGKIDLAIMQNNEVNVIDFKSKKRMTPNAIKGLTKTDSGNEYRQLQFYKLLWERSRENERVTEGSLTFLTPEKGKTLTERFVLEEKDKEEITKTLSDVLVEIYEGKFLSKKCEDETCEFCRGGFVL